MNLFSVSRNRSIDKLTLVRMGISVWSLVEWAFKKTGMVMCKWFLPQTNHPPTPVWWRIRFHGYRVIRMVATICLHAGSLSA